MCEQGKQITDDNKQNITFVMTSWYIFVQAEVLIWTTMWQCFLFFFSFFFKFFLSSLP